MTAESLNGPRVSWPANHRAALTVIIDVNAPSEASSNGNLAPGLEYTATGLQRLLKLLADLDLAATTAWSGPALATFPQLARLAQDGGHELALSRGGESSLEHHVALLSKISDTPAVGVFEQAAIETSPVEPDASSSDLLSGARWAVSGAGGDVPFHTGDDADNVVNIPVSPYWTDIAWLAPDRPLPPSSFLEAWSLSLAAVRTEGHLMVVVLHPHISGRPGISSQVERFLDEAIDSGDVWIATAGQVADWWRRESTDEDDR